MTKDPKDEGRQQPQKMLQITRQKNYNKQKNQNQTQNNTKKTQNIQKQTQ